MHTFITESLFQIVGSFIRMDFEKIEDYVYILEYFKTNENIFLKTKRK